MKHLIASLVLALGLMTTPDARADRLTLGSGLTPDTLLLAGGYEHALSDQFSLSGSLSLLSFVALTGTYHWTSSEDGPYTSLRGGVGLSIPLLDVYAHQGYRFRLSERTALDLEAGLGVVLYQSTQPLYSSDPGRPSLEPLLLPSLGLRLSFRL